MRFTRTLSHAQLDMPRARRRWRTLIVIFGLMLSLLAQARARPWPWCLAISMGQLAAGDLGSASPCCKWQPGRDRP